MAAIREIEPLPWLGAFIEKTAVNASKLSQAAHCSFHGNRYGLE
jgi:hypothetical protein